MAKREIEKQRNRENKKTEETKKIYATRGNRLTYQSSKDPLVPSEVPPKYRSAPKIENPSGRS